MCATISIWFPKRALLENNRRSLADQASVFLATGLFVSYLPSAILSSLKDKKNSQTLIEKKWTGAGLFGSIEGALTYLFLPASVARAWWALAAGFALSVYFAGRAERALASHDDSRIVIDEWIGAWIAVWGLPQHMSGVFVGAFLLFRFFDVWKGPIGQYCQRFPGGWGVTMDDIYAGVAANALWRISVGVFHLSY